MNELLKQRITVNGVELANRLVMPPMATGKSDDGKVSQELIDYYDTMSKGGYIGLIITEHSYINRNGIAGANQVSVAEDSDIEGLKKIADVIHKNGSKAVLQMNHAGERKPGSEALSVSGIPNPRAKKDEVKELHILTKEEIKGIVEDFVNAAKRVKAAGFDGVEIHCAHSYLLNQFYSPLTNHRTDEYGGCVENRVRAVQEVIHAVREAVGEDYLVVLRLGACDYLEGGNTIEDALAAAKILEKEIDLLDVSGGMNGYVIPGLDQPGYFKEVTALFKKELSVPVILAGGVTTAEQANALIEEGCADMIGVARAMLKDPEWAKKEMSK